MGSRGASLAIAVSGHASRTGEVKLPDFAGTNELPNLASTEVLTSLVSGLPTSRNRLSDAPCSLPHLPQSASIHFDNVHNLGFAFSPTGLVLYLVQGETESRRSMACNRHVISRAPSPRAKRRKIQGVEPQIFESQRKWAEDLNGNSMRVPTEPFVDLPHVLAFENSIVSFASSQSTYPSAGIPDRTTSLTSGSVSRLEHERGLSVLTPSTPTGSSNGDPGDPGANTVQIEHQSPNNADSALRGINDNSYYPGGCGAESWYQGVPLIESPDETSRTFEWNQGYSPGYIAVPRPPRTNPPKGPWNECHLPDDVQVNVSQVFEEGFIVQPGYGFTHSARELPLYVNQRISSVHGSRIDVQSLFVEQVLREQPSTRDVWKCQEEAPADENTPSSTSSASMGSPVSIVQEKTAKRGRRKGRLTESQRENAAKMRVDGCCYRCFIMKERCVVEDSECNRCRELSNKYRTWPLPCSRVGLDRRSRYMSPDALTLKLKKDQVVALVKDNVRCAPGCKPFELPLALGSGIPLQLDVIEVSPQGEETTRMFSFGLDENGSTVPTEMISPPLAPYMWDRILITKKTNNWIDCVMRDPDSDFLEDCFPEPHEILEREMLTIIARYHRDHLDDLEVSGEGPYQTLRWAFKMAVLNHIMSRPLVVPEDKVEALSDQLRFYEIDDRDRWVCPRLTNRVIKNMLLPMLQCAGERVLRDLSSSKMLRARGGENRIWDQVFSIVFLCLIVVGKTQASLAEYAELATQKGDESFSFEQAKTAIAEMEGELGMHLIGMFHYRFGTTKNGNGRGKTFNPLARDAYDRPLFKSKLADEVRWAIATYGDGLAKSVDLQRADLRKMKKENVRRLLGDFMKPFLLK